MRVAADESAIEPDPGKPPASRPRRAASDVLERRPLVAIDGRFLQRPTYAERGIGRVAREVALRLPAAAPDLRFVLLGVEGEPFDLGEARPAALDRATFRRHFAVARAPRVKLALFLEEPALRRALRRLGARALLTPSPHAAFPGSPVPRVVLLLDAIPQRFPAEEMPTLFLRAFHALTRAGTAGARRVVAISRATARDGVRLLGLRPGRIRVAHLGCDARFRPPRAEEVAALRARLGLPERFILCLGGFDARKNVPELLSSFGRIAAAAPEPHLVLTGRVEEHQRRPLEQAIAALGAAAARVRTLGFVADRDLPALFGAAAALAFPSRYEGFGLPLLEALACGTPAVAYRNSSIPEVAGDAALLVPDGDAAAFGAALLRLIEDEALRRDLRARGPERARAFRWEETARVVAGALREAAR